MLIEISVMVIACSIVVLAVCTVLFIKSILVAVRRTNQTLNVIQSELAQTSHDLRKFIQSANQMTDDVHAKLRTMDAMFQAISISADFIRRWKSQKNVKIDHSIQGDA